MKKLFVVLVGILLLFTGCGKEDVYNQILSEGQLVWGSSIEQVKKSEPSTLSLESKDFLMYNDSKIFGLSCSVLYQFDNDKLSHVVFTLNEKYSNDNLYYEDYLNIIKTNTEKYGDPISSEEHWFKDTYKGNSEKIGYAIYMGEVIFVNSWENDTTKVGSMISGNGSEISTIITYQQVI